MNQSGSTRQTTPPRAKQAARAAAPARGGLDEVVAAALDSAPVGLIVLNPDRTIRLLTRGAAGLLGLKKVRATAGLSILRLLTSCRALSGDAARQFAAALEGAGPEPQQILLHPDGPGSARTLAVDIRAADRAGWVVSLEDVTQTRQTQDWLLEHVSSDTVTGLWNRQHFMLMLQDGLTRAVCDPAVPPPCLLLIGVGGLKRLTEAAGPGAGDVLLRMMADRLTASLNEDDMIGRFGADEFALALPRPADQASIAAQCARLVACLSRPCLIDGQPVTPEIHVGVALAPEDGQAPGELIAHAGLALLAAATDGTASTRFFDPGLTERAHLRRALEADLRLAMDRREFELHYQPQVDVYRGCVTGLEALIRWRCPKRGLVQPGAFIALAEEIGLIVQIGDWVLHEACREAVLWPDDVTVAVNASPLQFETGRFARSVADALASTGLPARRLEVEVTESLLLRDTGTVLDTLAALQEQGVRLVLDDFGTGYASLSQLSRFRFDKIKIDRSFVSPVDASLQHSAIVRSIAALGTSLGIPTTAEGVETATQLEQIKADGCTCVQGYFFSHPVPPAEVAAMMSRLHRPKAPERRPEKPGAAHRFDRKATPFKPGQKAFAPSTALEA